MATNRYRVQVGGATYEVAAPDANTAWQWANATHAQNASRPATSPAPPAPLAPSKPQGSEFGRGLSMGYEQVKETPAAVVRATQGANLAELKSDLALMKSIDAGKFKPEPPRSGIMGMLANIPITDLVQPNEATASNPVAEAQKQFAYDYSQASPKERAAMRKSRADRLAASTSEYQQRLQEAQAFQQRTAKYRGSVEKLTDIGSKEGFFSDLGDYLLYNVGQGIPQIAPMLAAAKVAPRALGPLAVGATSATMEYSGTEQERLAFAVDQTKHLPPRQQAQAIADYMEKAGDVTLLTAVASGSLDAVLGPAAQFTKNLTKKTALKAAADKAAEMGIKGAAAKTVKQAVKEELKAVPRQVGEEFLTGAAQQGFQIAGKRTLGEQQGDLFSKENALDILNAAAAEATGALGGAGINVLGQATSTAAYNRQQRARSAEIDRLAKEGSAAFDPTQLGQQFEGFVRQYKAAGKSDKEAYRLAGQAVMALPSGQKPSATPTKKAAPEAPTALAPEEPTPAPPATGIDMSLPKVERAKVATALLNQAILSRRFNVNDVGDKDFTAAKLQLADGKYNGDPVAALEAVTGKKAPAAPAVSVAPVEAAAPVPPVPVSPVEAAAPPAPPAPVAPVEAAVPAVPAVPPAPAEAAVPPAPVEAVEAAVPAVPESEYTPQKIAENLDKFAAPEAAQRGLDPSMFREGAVDVQQGREPIPDQQILDAMGPQALEAYKTGAQWAQERIAEAAAPEEAAVPAVPEEAAVPAVPAVPEEAAVPAVPEEAAVPAVPAVPEEAAVPSVPEEAAVPTAPNATAYESPVFPEEYDVGTEEVRRVPSLARRLRKYLGLLDNGRISPEMFANYTRGMVERVQEARREKTSQQLAQGRVRGADYIRQRLLEAKRRGDISEEAADMAEWFINKNPALVDDLGIAFRAPKGEQAAAQYTPLDRVIRLLKERGADSTVVHEIMHHLERMMPEKVQNGIRRSWARALAKATKDAKTEAAKKFFALVNEYHYGDAPAADRQSMIESAKGMISNGSVPYELYQYVNPSEFWAVNASDIVQGRFEVQGSILKQLRNWLSGIASKIKDVFGLPSNAPILRALDSLSKGDGEFQSKQMLMPERGLRGMEYNAPRRKTPTAVEKTERKLATSHNVAETSSAASRLLGLTREPVKGVQFLKTLWDTGNVKMLRAGLGAYTLRGVASGAGQYSKAIGTQLNRIVQGFDSIATTRARLHKEILGQIELWQKFGRKYPELNRVLSDLLHSSTLDNIDVRRATSLANLIANDPKMVEFRKKYPNKRTPGMKSREDLLKKAWSRWEQLGREGDGDGRKIFDMAVEAYKADFERRYDTLVAYIKDSGLSLARQVVAINTIDKTFESARKLGLYVPLVRDGDYWYSVGKGANRVARRFTSEFERDVELKNEIAKRQDPQNKQSLDEYLADLRASGEITTGYDPGGLQKEMLADDAADSLRRAFDALDAGNAVDAESAKDMVFQMYLAALPEASAAKRMMHRKGFEGFSGDALRNFAAVRMAAANQHARLAEARPMRNALAVAYAMVAENPERERLGAFVDETASRVAEELNAAPETGWVALASKAVSFGTKAAFLKYMTAPKALITQMLQLPIVGTMVLTSRYGPGAVLTLAARYVTTFPTKFGTTTYYTDLNGDIQTRWGELSIAKSRYVTKPSDTGLGEALRYGFSVVADSPLFSSTFTADLTDRAETGSERFDSKLGRGSRAAYNFITGGVHHGERLSREVMFASALELEYKRLRAQGVPQDAAQRLATDVAKNLTYEAMFDYSPHNKARYLKSLPGRITFQFMQFPLNFTSFLIRNFMTMLSVMPTAREKREAATKFFGTLGVTWLFGGTIALPLYSTLWGFATSLRDLMRPELGEDDEDYDYDTDETGNPLGKRDLKTWFENWFLPHYFGPDTFAERAIKMGPISAATDLNFGASVSLDGLFFRDEPKDTGNWVQDVVDYLATMGVGASGSAMYEFADGLRMWMDGDAQRGMEKMMPVGFFRPPLTAMRLAGEGMVTPQGAPMADKPGDPGSREWYTFGKLLGQGVGYGSTTIAEMQRTARNVKKLEEQVKRERTNVYKEVGKADLNYEKNPTEANFDKFLKALEVVDEYNYRNGSVNPITSEQLSQSLNEKARARLSAMRGYMPGENFDSVAYDFIYGPQQ